MRQTRFFIICVAVVLSTMLMACGARVATPQEEADWDLASQKQAQAMVDDLKAVCIFGTVYYAKSEFRDDVVVISNDPTTDKPYHC